MRDEQHRLASLEAFNNYLKGSAEIHSYDIRLLTKELIPIPDWNNCIYILRLGDNQFGNEPLAKIVNASDPNKILYVGGHKPGKISGRFNQLIRACRSAEIAYRQNDFALNDKSHSHDVASWLTTSLLKTGFSIDDCRLDLVRSMPDADELEMIIGYQETFHHLPPWNTVRGGFSGYTGS